MAMHRVYYVACDGCGKQHKADAVRWHKEGARRAAGRDGWSLHVNNRVAWCPACQTVSQQAGSQ